jgi:hypothetical protein
MSGSGIKTGAGMLRLIAKFWAKFEFVSGVGLACVASCLLRQCCSSLVNLLMIVQSN